MGQTADVGTTRRRDAERNHRAILDAATQLLTTRGRVPMYDVAREAGVGQATLYRHFPDRNALVTAVLVERLDAHEPLISAHAGDPDGLFVLLRAIIGQNASAATITEVLYEEGTGSSAVDAVRARLLQLVGPPIETAVRHGRLRPDFTPADLLLVLAMADGVMQRTPVDRREALADRAVDLVLHGIARR